jgi:hypothetical protein
MMAETVKKDTKTKNIHQKVLDVTAALGRIPKRGHNDFQNYDYVTEADILEAVSAAQVEAGIVVYPNCVKDETERFVNKDGKTITERRVLMAYTIVNVDNPKETVTLVFPGDSHDTGDKAIYKALTGAEKYFLMKTYMIPTGDDPEKDGEKPPLNPKSEHLVEKPGANLANEGKTVEELRQEIQDWLWEMSGKDGKQAKKLLEQYSAFEGKNKETGEPELVSTDDPQKLSIKWARRVHHEVRQAYNDWTGVQEAKPDYMDVPPIEDLPF